MEFSYHEKVLVDLMNLEFCNFASLVDEMSNKVVILSFVNEEVMWFVLE